MANMFNMSALVTGFHWSTCSCMGSGFLQVCMELNYPLAMHNVAMDNSQFRSICRWFGFPFADMIAGDDWHPWCRWVSPHFWWLNRPPSFGGSTCAHLQLVFCSVGEAVYHPIRNMIQWHPQEPLNALVGLREGGCIGGCTETDGCIAFIPSFLVELMPKIAKGFCWNAPTVEFQFMGLSKSANMGLWYQNIPKWLSW